MKTLLIILIILMTGCGQQNKNGLTNNLNDFNTFLGQEKSLAFNRLVESFDSFIKTNYPDKNNQSDKIREFLEQLSSDYLIDSSWVFQTSHNKEIINQIENSGLRKEIWIYEYEDYKPIYNIFELLNDNKPDSIYETIDSSIHHSITDEILSTQTTEDLTELLEREKKLLEKYRNQLSSNTYGQFLYGLAKYNPTNDFIQEYVKVKIAAGDIAYEIMSGALLGGVTNFEEPFIKRLIVTEIYYDLVKWDIQRKS